MKTKIDFIDSYNNAFRDLVNGKVFKPKKEEETFKDFIQRALKLNDGADWAFLCTAMDIIGDSSLAIRNFFRFGIDGPTRLNDEGEKYLRLYGVLNAVYIQCQAIINLHRICQVNNNKMLRQKFDDLEIIKVRHKLGAHPTAYLSDGDSVECFVPVRFTLGGYNCEFYRNNDLVRDQINLKEIIENHLELMLDTYQQIYEKLANTLYRCNKDKLEEVMAPIKKVKLEREGYIVAETEGGPRIIMSLKYRPETEPK